jgi:hypothetical protein
MVATVTGNNSGNGGMQCSGSVTYWYDPDVDPDADSDPRIRTSD